MAFPGTYNINYYEGDTYEFRIYPKTSNGESFPLTDFSANFTISTSRGATGIPDAIECLTNVNSSGGYVDCVILPDQGRLLVPGTSYVYDVQISKTNYKTVGSQIIPGVFTLLTGTLVLTADVSETA